MQTGAQTGEISRSVRLGTEITLEEQARMTQGLPAIAPLEGFDIAEYYAHDTEKDLILVFNSATYRQQLESVNSFVVTDPVLTSLPVVLLVRTRTRLAAVVVGIFTVGIVAFVGFPSPYSWVALLALLGPLSGVAYGLKSQS